MFLDAFSVVWTQKVLSLSCIISVTPPMLAMELRPTYALSTQTARLNVPS